MAAFSGVPLFIVLAGGLAVLAALVLVWLRFGARPPPVPPPPTVEVLPTEVELAQLLASAGRGQGAVRIVGALRVSSDTVLPPGFVVEGSLTVAENCALDALVEVRGDAILEPGARLARAIVVQGDLTLGSDVRTAGCHVGGAVHLYPGAVVDSLLDCGKLYVYQEKELLAIELEEIPAGEPTPDRGG